MANRIFEINTEALFGAEAFIGATKEELRVLVAVMADRAATDERIAEAAGVTAARCRSALTLFEEEKILIRKEALTDEFDVPIDEPDEDSAIKVAKDIRDSGLAALIAEFAKLLEKPALSTGQVKKIVALYTNYSLCEEYILTLGAYLADCGKLTVTRLVNEAIKLVEREIDTPEALVAYIEEKKTTTDADARLRKFFRFYNRALTKDEHIYFRRWIYDYGFSEEIIGEAYQICVNNTEKYNAKYIDHILARWHEAGCKTLSECLALTERDRVTLAEESKKKSKAKSDQKNEGGVPKYGAFSAEDALMRALERSYGTEEN